MNRIDGIKIDILLDKLKEFQDVTGIVITKFAFDTIHTSNHNPPQKLSISLELL